MIPFCLKKRFCRAHRLWSGSASLHASGGRIAHQTARYRYDAVARRRARYRDTRLAQAAELPSPAAVGCDRAHGRLFALIFLRATADAAFGGLMMQWP
jgi:hypothetical protein